MNNTEQTFQSFHFEKRRSFFKKRRYAKISRRKRRSEIPIERLYIAPLQDVIATYNLSYMFYADDNQLYIAVNPNDTPQVSLDKLRECTQAILHWNTQNMLSTNPGITEVIHFTSRFQKQPIALDTFKFANTDVTVSDKVRNLGVIMDKNLSFTNHINDMCKKATLAIRSIGRICKYLPNDGIKRLVNALVMSRLDYSNSLLYGLPKYQIDKLQRLQNTAARLVAGTRRSDHIKPVLKDLHWLPIQSRIIDSTDVLQNHSWTCTEVSDIPYPNTSTISFQKLFFALDVIILFITFDFIVNA